MLLNRIVLIYTAFWLVLSVIGVLNGTLRVYSYGKYMDELTAHQLSTVTGIILTGIAVWLINLRWGIQSSGQALLIGIIWLILTILFEFIFGHYVVGHPWSRLFHDYNLLEGRIWALMLVWITAAPYVVYRIRA